MKRLAIYDINDYLLNATPVGEMLGYSGVGLRPIIPVQQQPEMNEQNPTHPYIVYAGRSTPDPQQWWMHEDIITYMIWGKEQESLNEIANEIVDVLARLDTSANELNRYLASVNRTDFIFYYVQVTSVMTPEAANAEGGRYGKPLTFRYEYSKTAGRDII